MPNENADLTEDAKRESEERRRRVSRREFVKAGSALGVGVALAPLVLQLRDAAAAPVASAAEAANLLSQDDVLVGLYEGNIGMAVTRAAERLDFSWLNSGDSVAIKVASNSGNPHPAVTSPGAVQAMVAVLKERGAGRVVVADQAGVEHVRLTNTGRFSSTRERFGTNGLIALEEDAELHFFDDQGFEDGYFEASLPEGHRWPRGMYVANLVREVDHIVNMPRIGGHILSGLTLGIKNAVGWLRDDSRHDLHNDAIDFYEKYAEVNYVSEIAAKQRLTLSGCEKLMLHGGADEGTEYVADPPIVVASQNLANHDAVASSILVTLNNIAGLAPTGMVYSADFAATANSYFAEGYSVGGTDPSQAGLWQSGSPTTRYSPHPFENGITQDRSTVRGWELSGGQPGRIAVMLDGAQINPPLKDGIEAHGEGIYNFETLSTPATSVEAKSWGEIKSNLSR